MCERKIFASTDGQDICLTQMSIIDGLFLLNAKRIDHRCSRRSVQIRYNPIKLSTISKHFWNVFSWLKTLIKSSFQCHCSFNVGLSKRLFNTGCFGDNHTENINTLKFNVNFCFFVTWRKKQFSRLSYRFMHFNAKLNFKNVT